MNRNRPLAALFAAALVSCLPGCWPMAPIAAIAAAGGGGGGGGAAAIALTGTIVTDGTSFGAGLALDREPNDGPGTATPVPLPAAGRTVRGEGDTAIRLALHALVTQDGAEFVAGSDLLAPGEQLHALAAGEHAALARRGNELLLVATDAAGQSELRVTPLVSGLAKRRLPLALPVVVAGATTLLDALLVMDGAGITSRLVAFDVDDGAPLALHDLGQGGLAHLAGATELASGRERLFTCDPERGTLFEIELTGDETARRFGALLPLPIAGAAIDALGYDGAFLHVLRRDGVLESFDASFARIAARPFRAPDRVVRSLETELDLGIDSWQVEVPAGSTLHVALAAAATVDQPTTLFLAARPRAALTTPEQPTTLQIVRFAADGKPAELDLIALAGRPTGYDVWVGTLAGAARWQLALGGAARRPHVDVQPLVAPDPALDATTRALLSALGDDRLAALHDDPLLPEFVPGRLVVGRRDPGATMTLPPAPVGLAFGSAERSVSGFDRVPVATTAAWRGPPVRSVNGASSRRARRREESRALLAAIAALQDAPGVAWREPDWLAHTLAVPNDPGYSANQQWHYEMLNLPAAWDITTGDSATVLAVVDTGVRTDNVDLNANVGADGFDFISTTSNSGDGDGRDANPFDQGTFAGNGHHGSHCGGTVAARGDNNTQGAGICWNAELMMLRALGTDGFGSTTDIAEAIRYAAHLSNASGTLPAQRAGAINLSLGTSSLSSAIQSAVSAAISAGVIVCAAAGNDGNGQAVLYPAAHSAVIAIAAVDFSGGLAFYSNTGPEIDVACSGGSANGAFPSHDVWSTVGVGANGSLQPLAGTSMACAHATGIVGLLLGQYPALEQADAEALLRATAIDAGAPGFDEGFGYGIVDAAAAVNDVTAQVDFPTDEIDFGTTGTHLVAQAKNLGGGKLAIENVSLSSVVEPAGQPPTTSWLAFELGTDGTTLQLTADRTGLAAGAWQIQLDVDTNGGSDSLLVDLTATIGGPTDVGDVVIQLFEDDGTTLAKSFVAMAIDGYAWKLHGVPRGSYFLRCGVDLDQDGVLGELGEPFGAWPNVADEALLDYHGEPLTLDLLLE